MGENVQAAATESGEDLEPEFSAEELIDQLFKEYYIPPVGEGEFTVAMIVRRKKVGDTAARGIIEQALADGRIVEVGIRACGRHRAMAYRLKE